MGADGRGLLGSNLWNAVSYFECIRSGDHVYRASERAGASNCDVDGQVRY